MLEQLQYQKKCQANSGVWREGRCFRLPLSKTKTSIWFSPYKIEWEREYKFTREYQSGYWNKFNFFTYATSNPKILQIQILPQKSKDIYGLHIGTFSEFLRGRYPDESIRHAYLRGIGLGLTISDAELIGVGIAGLGIANQESKGVAMAPFTSQAQTVQGITASGLVAITRQELTGLSISGVLSTGGKGRGISFASAWSGWSYHKGITASGFVTSTTRELSGVSFAGIASAGNKGKGISLGGLYSGWEQFYGFSFSALKNKIHNLYGLSVAPINQSSANRGVQIGIINYARETSYLQFGILNISQRNLFPILP
ncbi:MAG: hypothetical protein AAF518_07960, partial [Spirochaetota bacterium]